MKKKQIYNFNKYQKLITNNNKHNYLKQRDQIKYKKMKEYRIILKAKNWMKLLIIKQMIFYQI